MLNDNVIQIWHHGNHWSIKKSGEQDWHRGKNETSGRPGYPQERTPQNAARAFRDG